jgi:hypothetical protein
MPVCVVLVAACGGSGSAASAPTAAGQGTTTAASTQAAATQGTGAASSAAGPGDCAAWKEAATTMSPETQLLHQAGSAVQWAAMTASTAPIVLSGGGLAAAVDVLSRPPGSGDLVAKYREIADLEKQAVSSGDPWGGGSGPGAQVQKKGQASFIDVGVALSSLLEHLGC